MEKLTNPAVKHETSPLFKVAIPKKEILLLDTLYSWSLMLLDISLFKSPHASFEKTQLIDAPIKQKHQSNMKQHVTLFLKLLTYIV